MGEQLSIRKIKKAYDILKFYNGDNNQILLYQNEYKNGSFVLNDFSYKYITSNQDYTSLQINKTIRISSDYGNILKEKYNIDFTPNKVKITKIIGEMNNSYHCYVQYRQSIPPQLMYVNKNYIIDKLFENKTDSYENIDFNKYDKLTEKYGRKLKPHQKEAIKFLLTNKKCILADSMGLGKTLDTIVAALEGGFKHILVITTASVKSTWKKEISYYEDEDNIAIMSGSKWVNAKKFTITNYDIVQNFYQVPYEAVEELDENGEVIVKLRKSQKKEVINESLMKSPLFQEHFDCVIIDEAQKLSNKTSIRYKTIYDFLHRAKPEAVFLVTGTPLTNKPINLYNILCLIDADITKDYNYYCMRYCDGRKMKLRTGKIILLNNGASHLDELREKIKHLYIRRLQSETNGMVSKTVLTKEYDLNEQQKEIYNTLWDNYLQAKKELGVDDAEKYKDLVEGIIVRQYLAKEMIPNTIELTDDQINYGEKVIIVCTFQEEIDILKEHYGRKAVVYNGKMTTKAKDKAVDSFMNNPNTTVFICNLTAASVGITLTASHYIIFNSYSWVSADNKQMEDRIYRLTQDKDVTCVYQMFTDSISKEMYDIVKNKELIAEEVIKTEKDK